MVWSTIIFLSATNSLDVTASNNNFNKQSAEGKVQFVLQDPPVDTATVGFTLEQSPTNITN